MCHGYSQPSTLQVVPGVGATNETNGGRVKAKSGIMEIAKGRSGNGCHCWIVVKLFKEITGFPDKLYAFKLKVSTLKHCLKIWKIQYKDDTMSICWGKIEREWVSGAEWKQEILASPIFIFHPPLFLYQCTTFMYNVIEKASTFHKLWNQMTSLSLVVSGSLWLALNHWSHH